MFLIMFKGSCAVGGGGAKRRVWALAQDLRPHFSESSQQKLEKIGKSLSLEMWEELLKRPAKQARARSSSSDTMLPKGVTLMPTSAGGSQPVTESTKLTQLMPQMLGDSISEFKMDLTLVLTPLKPRAYDLEWCD